MTTARDVAARFGLKTADQIALAAANDRDARGHGPVLAGVPIADTPERGRRSAHEVAAERALGHAFVVLVGYGRPVPRCFGDNRGMWPIRLEVHGDWREAGKLVDYCTPAATIVRLAVIACPSKAHGVRLKAALDEMLLGRMQAESTDNLRYAWRDATDFGELERWFPTLLAEAIALCELEAREFEVFDVAEHERRVRAWAVRRGRG